jgi:hypothetical protein
MKIDRNGILEDVLPEDYLELGNGKVVRNLKGLADAMETMNDGDFGLHVYGEQNDFAEWVLEGYWDESLAGKILGIRDRKKMIRLLRKVLKKAEKERFEKGGKKDVLKKIGKMG